MSTGDTRFHAGGPPDPPQGIQLDAPASSSPTASATAPGLARRLLAGALRRLVAAVPVALFGYVQYAYFLKDRRLNRFFTPYRALGPLYFLANQSPEDDWVGYALLAVAVPCLLAVVIWPRRWTMLIAIAVALAWVFPGCIEDRHM
jgi:hypothetical protein